MSHEKIQTEIKSRVWILYEYVITYYYVLVICRESDFIRKHGDIVSKSKRI